MTNRPERKRSLYTTMELCRNSAAGPTGSLELIVSTTTNPQPVYYFWPLSAAHTLSPSQLEDLVAVVGREVTEAIVHRMMVQAELPLA